MAGINEESIIKPKLQLSPDSVFYDGYVEHLRENMPEAPKKTPSFLSKQQLINKHTISPTMQAKIENLAKPQAEAYISDGFSTFTAGIDKELAACDNILKEVVTQGTKIKDAWESEKGTIYMSNFDNVTGTYNDIADRHLSMINFLNKTEEDYKTLEANTKAAIESNTTNIELNRNTQ